MKFRITFKDPNAAANMTRTAEENSDVWNKFTKHDECVTIEFDSQTGRAKVVPVRRGL